MSSIWRPRHLRAWLDGAELEGIDSRINIRRIQEDAPQMSVQYAARAGGPGQYLLARTRLAKKITIEYAILEIYDLAARAAIVDAVNGWAAAGRMLQISHRPGKRLGVVMTQVSGIGDPRNVGDTYRVELSALASPYWEDEIPTRWSGTGTTGTGTLVLSGTAEGRAEATVTPTGGALTAVTLNVGGTSIELTGLDIAQDTPLRIAYDAEGILTMVAGGGSVLSARTAGSSDDLSAAPGRVPVGFTASTACTVTIEMRGRWL